MTSAQLPLSSQKKSSPVVISSSTKTQRTTRICIKNIPPSFDEAKLRRHLLEGARGSTSSDDLTITDCRVLKTKDGKSRKLAFVGFKLPDQADRAVRAFHGTYAKTSRLTVELAFSKKLTSEEAGHRPWSKHSKGSSRYEKMAKQQETQSGQVIDEVARDEKESGKDQVDMQDEELERKKEEFLRVMGASAPAGSNEGGKSRVWANDDFATASKQQSSIVDAKVKEAELNESGGSASSGDDDTDGSSADDESIDSGGEGADALTGSRGAYAGASISDMEFLRSKVTQKDDLLLSDDNEGKDGTVDDKGYKDDVNESPSDDASSTRSDDGDSSDDSEEEEFKTGSVAAASGDVSVVDNATAGDSDVASNRLFVRNLPFSAMEEDVKCAFEPYGEVTECHIPVDDSKKNKGYAFVSFVTNEHAEAALAALDGSDFQGRLMHVIPARKARQEDHGGAAPAASTYKQQQELARKQNANNETGWSSSFVRGDAVVDNLAERLGLKKGDILNVKEGLSSGEAAVRLALGETQIIEENREYFGQHGVDMDILVSGPSNGKGGPKRSKEMILVKNLPYDTTEQELAKLFQGVGDAPVRILLPPSRTISLVEYGHSVDARRAFRKLAYKRFKHVPLYLEWAPLAAKQKDVATRDKKDLKETNASLADDEKIDQAEQEDDGGTTSQTLYVKNLSFSTNEQELLSEFTSPDFRARAARIPMKLAPVKKHVGRRVSGQFEGAPEMKELSMGFGFVEFESEKSARGAMKKLQGKLLNGHAMEISFSVATSKVAKGVKPTSSGGLRSKKLMVRNVPFQATRKEILQLFGSYGHLKKVRLPKKFDGSHRGFAFVEFLTAQEAQNAMKALSSTHLYGRHLVLEWADDKEDIDTLRDKAKRDVHIAGVMANAPKNKKIRFS